MSERAAFTLRKKLPAYGVAVRELRRQGLAPSGWLNVTRIWPRARRDWMLVVPSDADPAGYDYSLVRGLAVLLSTTSTARDNATLVSMIEAAQPAILAVVNDGECTGLVTP